MKDEKYVDRIIVYCLKIESYLEPIKEIQDFISNEEKIDAVLLNLEQIGETAKKLSKTFKDDVKDIDWNRIIGLRNIISHKYEGVNILIIYNIAVLQIRELLMSLLKLKEDNYFK